MGVVSLPPEILDEILGFCDQTTLTDFAILNHTCLHLARQHLYQSITLDSDTPSSRYPEHLLSYTRHVCILSVPAQPLLSILRDLGRLRSVQYTYIRYLHDEEFLSLLEQLIALDSVVALKLLLGDWPKVKSAGLRTLLASPKLCDLWVDKTGVTLPALANLRTFRFYLEHWPQLRSSVTCWTQLRRLLIAFSCANTDWETRVQQLQECISNVSENIGSVAFILASRRLDLIAPSDKFPKLRFSTLENLILDISTLPGTWTKKLSFVMEVLSMLTAPQLRTIHLSLSASPRNKEKEEFMNHRIWTWIRTQFPRCKVFVHFVFYPLKLRECMRMDGVAGIYGEETKNAWPFYWEA